MISEVKNWTEKLDDLFGTMFGAWVPGLGWGWGVTNILAMGVREAPGGPPADDFKATCSLQPGARLKASLPFLGVWGGTGGLPCRRLQIYLQPLL